MLGQPDALGRRVLVRCALRVCLCLLIWEHAQLAHQLPGCSAVLGQPDALGRTVID